MEKLLLPFPLFPTLMWKAPSVLQLCVARNGPPCHSPLVSELMGRATGGSDGWREQPNTGKDRTASLLLQLV